MKFRFSFVLLISPKMIHLGIKKFFLQSIVDFPFKNNNKRHSRRSAHININQQKEMSIHGLVLSSKLVQGTSGIYTNLHVY